MAELGPLARWIGRSSALPPVAAIFTLTTIDDPEVGAIPADAGLHPISAFVCIIDYEGEERLITCRRYDFIGENGYVGAICRAAGGYRQFRCDRIRAVFDAATGEMLGDGSYFQRFEIQSQRERAPTWGLSPSHKATLVGGLNTLAFMARCDGYWHPLENEAIEPFVCSMWLRNEWRMRSVWHRTPTPFSTPFAISPDTPPRRGSFAAPSASSSQPTVSFARRR
jgi:hypothetical protein